VGRRCFGGEREQQGVFWCEKSEERGPFLISAVVFGGSVLVPEGLGRRAAAAARRPGPAPEGPLSGPGPAPARRTRRRDVGLADGPVLYYLPLYYMILLELPAPSLRARSVFLVGAFGGAGPWLWRWLRRWLATRTRRHS